MFVETRKSFVASTDLISGFDRIDLCNPQHVCGFHKVFFCGIHTTCINIIMWIPHIYLQFLHTFVEFTKTNGLSLYSEFEEKTTWHGNVSIIVVGNELKTALN